MSKQLGTLKGEQSVALVLPKQHVWGGGRADRVRLIQVGFGIAALAIAYFSSVLLGLGQGALASPLVAESLVCLIGCIALGISLATIAADPRAEVDRLRDFGFVSIFALCVVLSTFPVRAHELSGVLGLPRMTLTCLAVAIYPRFVWAPLRKTAAFAALTSATQPLALLLFSPSPLPREILLASIGTATVAALVALWSGHASRRSDLGPERGRLVGAYRLTRRIAHGRNTETWRAEHELLARPAALKWISPRSVDVRSSPRLLSQFEKEAQAVASLTSPHTVTLFDFGVSPQGHVYQVTELPEGRTLAEAIEDQGPLPADEVLRLAAQICDSLAEAHEHGIFHGHLTANSVLLCRVGGGRDHVKVLEYGLSQLEPGWEDESDARFASDVAAFGHLIELMATGHYNPTDEEHAEVDPRLRTLIDLCTSGRFADAREIEAVLLGGPHMPTRELLVSRGPIPSEEGAPRHPEASENPLRLLGQLFAATNRYAANTPLSSAQLESARLRLAHLAIWVFLGNLLLGATLAWYLRPPWSVEAASLAVLWTLGIGCDVAMRYAARSQRLPTRRVLGIGLAYACVRTILHTALAVVLYRVTGMLAPGLTFAGLAIVAYPQVVPTPPRQMLPVAAPSTLANPLLLFLLADPPASTALLGQSAVVAALAVGLSYCITTLAYGVSVVQDRSRDLGSYELLELIGRGAMGEVWRARHQLLARPAALKTIRRDRASLTPEHLSQLWREARITARLTSPHTVRLFDYGVTEGGICFYAMELLRGVDLQELVERTGPVDPVRAVEIALDVCDALREAHALGLVHRDLKPGNLFQCSVGRRDDLIKVLDFGLARLNRPLGSQAADNSVRIVGTPAYMAPETLLGQTADARTDIYALGAVLFFLLSGQHVFEKSSAVATVLARIQEKAPSVSDVSAQPIPKELDDIVSLCLMRDPGARFQSVEDLEEALFRVPSRESLAYEPELSRYLFGHDAARN